jgi:hypothetical protein
MAKKETKEAKDMTKSIHAKYQWEEQRLHDRRPVKGIFRFNEVPGGTLRFSYLKYKGDPIEKFELTDGEVYTLPLGVAKHLRNSGWYPIHSYALDEENRPSKRIGQKVHRYSFEPLEFIGEEEFHNQSDKELVTISNI